MKQFLKFLPSRIPAFVAVLILFACTGFAIAEGFDILGWVFAFVAGMISYVIYDDFQTFKRYQ